MSSPAGRLQDFPVRLDLAPGHSTGTTGLPARSTWGHLKEREFTHGKDGLLGVAVAASGDDFRQTHGPRVDREFASPGTARHRAVAKMVVSRTVVHTHETDHRRGPK